MFAILSVFTSVSTILASLGLILATSSFISGLQLVRAASIVEAKIHRYNGFMSICLFLIIAIASFVVNGIFNWTIFGWLFAASIIVIKLYIVRKRRRAFKYVSWIGGTLILVWLTILYVNIPV